MVLPAALPYNRPMLNADRINEIHRLFHGEHWSARKIARHLHLSRKTLRKYIQSPVQTPARRQRTSKIDPFKPTVAGLLEQDPSASAVVILQRLRPLGYEGGITILRNYVSQLRGPAHPPRAFVRVEPGPAERFEVDWGHFGTLDYAGDKRNLYAFCLVEGHSRMLYVEFTHSQSFESFVRCHLHAFEALHGVARECWYDNLLTVVAEHVGTLVRFNPRFLAFARECGFFPRACNPAAGWEKGKVERGGVGYVRQNFWPLRQFTDLSDVNRQVREWLEQVANLRLHRETRQRPYERFRPDCLRPLPALLPDYRDTVEALVHKDLRLQFDGNRYCAPPHLVGQRLTVKADASSVALYLRNQEIVRYPRCWRRGQTFGAERFEKELLAHKAAAHRSQAQRRLIALLASDCSQETVEAYLRGLTDSNRALTRQITELLQLVRQYGPQVVAAALQKALAARAFGADYVANLLRQQLSPRNPQPPLQLRDPQLNQLVTDPLSLLDYDAFIVEVRKESHDSLGTETRTTETVDDEPKAGADLEGSGSEKP
jgi:transposase